MISAVVMAHPTRAQRAERLAGQLGIGIVWDQHGDVVDTARRALLACEPTATHHLVLQDDAIVCRDLLAGLTKACEVAGERPVSPYLGTWGTSGRLDVVGRIAHRARQTGAPWVETTGPRWGVAVAHPVRLLPQVIDHYDQFLSKCDDARLNAAYKQMGITCWYTMPCLVEHDDSVPSVTKPSYTTRRAAFWFIGSDRSALDIDWSGPVIRK